MCESERNLLQASDGMPCAVVGYVGGDFEAALEARE